jgi:hypothetical protein
VRDWSCLAFFSPFKPRITPAFKKKQMATVTSYTKFAPPPTARSGITDSTQKAQKHKARFGTITPKTFDAFKAATVPAKEALTDFVLDATVTGNTAAGDVLRFVVPFLRRVDVDRRLCQHHRRR